jgi:pSer/pThr/pTyr-binding forkhead associated (FHA) protein
VSEQGDGTKAFDVAGLVNQAAPRQEPAVLVVVQGRNLGRSIELDRPRTGVGRREDNDLILDSDTVSREHACVERTGETYAVMDLQSRNGVYVNGRRIPPGQRRELGHGDTLTLGDETLLFRRPDQGFSKPGLPAIEIDRTRVEAEVEDLMQLIVRD